jgi:molecular chaperone Hsp33
LLSTLLSGFDVEVTSRYPLAWHCPCSKERVVRALLTLGRSELEDMLRKEGKAEVTCHFCETRYEVSGEELRALLQASESAGPSK